MPLISPEKVNKGVSWEGTSPHPQTNVQVPNKETAMPWIEHQNIVAASASLLASQAVPSIFTNLRLALGHVSVQNKKATIYVTKGIHQPYTNPHLQIQTETFTWNDKTKEWGGAFVQTYHLNVSAEANPDIDGLTDRFTWKGVQYTIDNGGAGKCWPVVAPRTMKLQSGAVGRRNSVSGPAFAARVKQLADEAATAKAIADFDTLCEAFEKAHKTKPIDRGVRTDFGSAWSPKTHTVAKAHDKGSVFFKYSPSSKQITLALNA